MDELLKQVYKMGWIEASSWANRDDLRADMDSPAYKTARDFHIDALKEIYKEKEQK